MNPKKVAVIGISGSGKSMYARRLAQQTGLPLLHMDMPFWKGNWQAVSEEEYLCERGKLIHKDQWIIEG